MKVPEWVKNSGKFLVRILFPTHHRKVTNKVIAVGAVLIPLAIFPLFGLDAALSEHLAIGLAFVGVSLARSYLLRRMFEGLR